MRKIFYAQEAGDNLAGIFEFIAEDNLFHAAKVITDIKSTIDILKIFPFVGSSVDKNTRMIVDPDHKYKVVYQIKGNNIYVLAISKYRNI